MKAATGLEPGTVGSGFQCSTTELYNFWYRTYNQLALLFDRYIKLNRYNKKNKKIKKLKAATRLEPGTFGSGFQCSTSELYNFWYRIYNQLALLFDIYIKLNRYYNNKKIKKTESSNWSWTRHLWVGVPMLYHWAI